MIISESNIINDKSLIDDVARALGVSKKDLAVDWSGKSRIIRYYGNGHEGSKVAFYNARNGKLEIYGIRNGINDSIKNESVNVDKLIKSGNKSELTKYLASLGDGSKVVDPYNKDHVFLKASNGVRSGWGERINGKRINVYLWSDSQVSQFLIDYHASRVNESADIEVKNPGILEVPYGKSVTDLPASHFKSLIDKHGREKIIRALTNLEVWNRNDNKSLSNWAKSMKDQIGDYGSKKESINPFNWLKKVNGLKPSDPTPKGCVTDGLGNVYQVPTSGRSQWIMHNGFKYAYNYGTRELEIYDKATGKKLISSGLSVENFLDNPDYWVDRFLEDY